MTHHFTDDNFKVEAIDASNDKPVLVDFYATWCGPCKMQAPIIEEVAEAIGDKAVVGKLDTEQAMKIAQDYNVMSIPTLIIFRQGKEAKRFVGVQMKDELIAELTNLA